MTTLALTDVVTTLLTLTQVTPYEVFSLQDLMDTPGVGWESFVDGWLGMTDLGVLVPMAASVLTAVLLAFPIAYHPRIYRRATTLDEIEAPKGIIGYAAVSAGIAQVVAITPAMALVVFGIGGIYRFRTRAGPPKLIYPTVGVVVIGLACGMMVFPLAIVLAVIAWLLPFWSESRYAVSLRVRNLTREGTRAALAKYRRTLEQHGGQVVSVQTQHTGQFSIVANLPARVNPADVEADLQDMRDEEGGDIGWDTR
jgi:hypothetical protein